MSGIKLDIHDVEALNAVSETLNRAVDRDSALQSALDKLLEIMQLETGWIFLRKIRGKKASATPAYTLAASTNLPAAIAASRTEAWKSTCDCQEMCARGELTGAYTEIQCSRLVELDHTLRVHATAPLRLGDEVLGILNIAARDWDSFSERNLAILSRVGEMMGTALERAGHYDALRNRRMQEQSALLELSNKLLGRGELLEVGDLLVEEACRLLRVNAGALLLIDQTRDAFVFQSSAGWLEDPLKAGHIVPLGTRSGPELVLESQVPLVVHDLETNDPTHWAPPWIRSEGFRGHVVVPLVSEGVSIGVLVLDTRSPREFKDDELRFLQLLANQGAIAVDRARQREEEIERRRMEQELQVGRRIQLSLLPESEPQVPGWSFAARNLAAREVGGDFYDFFWLPEPSRSLGLVIGDVTGKGVPAALLMAVSRTTIRSTALSGRPPSQALVRANELILKDTRTDLFLSVFYASLDTGDGMLTFANAGHNRPLHLPHASEECEELESEGIVLGAFDQISLEERTVKLQPGDLLLCYTDGVTEAIDPQLQSFGLSRLKESLLKHRAKPAPSLLQAILEDVESFSGGEPQFDDLTLLLITRDSSPP